MELEQVCHGSVGIFRLTGELDLHSADGFRDVVDEYVDVAKAPDVVIDLSGVGFMDSSGLGALLARYRRIKSCGGRMVIVGPAAAVEKVMVLGGLHRLVPVRPTEREALDLLAGGNSGV